jgi:monoamine oxidase
MASSASVYNAIVVGAGHNGLTAAAYLARAGLHTLVLERREIVGGCCVTEEIAPGCRASTTSYIASMLRPEVIRELQLAEHGLHMVPCDPALQVPFPDGHVVSWWADRERAAQEFRKISAQDAERFLRVDDQLKKLARYLQPFFLEPPLEINTGTLAGWSDLLCLAKRQQCGESCNPDKLKTRSGAGNGLRKSIQIRRFRTRQRQHYAERTDNVTHSYGNTCDEQCPGDVAARVLDFLGHERSRFTTDE